MAWQFFDKKKATGKGENSESKLEQSDLSGVESGPISPEQLENIKIRTVEDIRSSSAEAVKSGEDLLVEALGGAAADPADRIAGAAALRPVNEKIKTLADQTAGEVETAGSLETTNNLASEDGPSFEQTDHEKIRQIQETKNRLNLALLYKERGTNLGSNEMGLIFEEESGELYEKLLGNNAEFYVTDTIGLSREYPENEGRVLMDGATISRYADFLKKEATKNNPEKMQEVGSLLNEYVDFAKSKKKILTRPGMDSVADLLSDGVLARHLAPDGLDEEAYNRLNELAQELNKVNNRTELQEIDPAIPSEGWPLEIQVLIAENPEAGSLINRLAKKYKLELKTKTGSAEDVVSAIHDISTLTQHKFQTNWLKRLVKEDKNPKLTLGSDIKQQVASYQAAQENLKQQIAQNQTAQEQHPDAAGKYQAKDEKLQASLQEVERFLALTQQDNLEQDLQNKVELIRNARNDYKEFVCLDESVMREEDKEDLVHLNQMFKGINDDYALRRLQFDLSDEQSSEAQETVKKMMMVGPVAHTLEMMNLGAVAKIFAASSDDLMGEWAEIQALKGAGYSTKEIIKRAKVAVPVFAAATYGATKVEKLLEGGNNLAAGATFGVTAVALSLATSVQSMKMYKEGYKELVKEGKISGESFVASNPEFKKKFKEFSQGIDKFDKEKMLSVTHKVLDEINLNQQLLSEEEEQDLLRTLDSLDEKQFLKLIKKNFNAKAWKEAIAQDFNNPVRLGILIGSLSAPVVGLATGGAGLLGNGFVLAGVGSVESISGGVTVMGARRLLDYKWKTSLQNRLRAGQESDTETDENEALPEFSGVAV